MTKNLILFLFLSLLFITGCRNENKKQALTGGADSTKVILENLNQQISDHPKDAELYEQRAKLYLGIHQIDNALKDVNKAISLDPGKTDFFVTLSDIYLFMGQPEKSKEALIKSIELNSKNLEAYSRLAKLYLIVKDYRNCYETVKKILNIDNNYATAYFTQALGLLEQGDTNRAVANLMQAVDKNQAYYEAYIQLGELYSLKKNPLAVGYLKNAIRLRPASREALYMLGMYYQETGSYENAIATYQNLSKSDTLFRESPYNIGYIYLVYLKDFPQAITYFTKSLNKDPGYYQAYFNRGYAYELSGNYAKATEDYQKSLKIKVNYDKAVEGLNRIDKKKIK
ncbi:MAG: tetratricopeptide repeat protein [Bacteroidales bacterium]|nr:tetratricopeptide repeat protein [Bacteroidales bacterium]